MPPPKFPCGLEKNFPGRYGSASKAGPIQREAGDPVQPRAGREADEGKIRPRPRQDLVAGDLDFLIQVLQLPIIEQRLLDQACQPSIIIKFFDPEPGRVFRAGRPVEVRRQARSRLRSSEGGDSAGRQGQHHDDRTRSPSRSRASSFFAPEKLAERFICLVLEEFAPVGNPAE